ncbi:MAG TPA: twin-arginine translocation signal domain-containing protein [Luteolibacter sp.]
MYPLPRRDFIKTTAVAMAAMGIPGTGQSDIEATLPGTEPVSGGVELHWLEGTVPGRCDGTTWGVPWPRGRVSAGQTFALNSPEGEAVPVQSWPLAYWPDGSLKWSGHSMAGGVGHSRLLLAPGKAAGPARAVTVVETADEVTVDTGVIQCRIPKRGSRVIGSITREGHELLRDGKLVASCQDQPDLEAAGALRWENFESDVSSVAIEQAGPVRAVLKLTGHHRSEGREWLPFTLRLYFHAGGEAVRLMHSFVFDGDETQDFLRGLGMRFSVPMRDPLHDRHIRFCGENGGLWAEAVRNLTGLRRDPGADVVQAQLAGVACPPVERIAERARERLSYIPAWGDYTLVQLSPDAFGIRKRTKAGHAWISAAHGGRSSGTGFIGGATGGGIAFGLRDFWKRFPTQLDVRGAAGELAEVTMWLWSPEASAMDLRFYHDGLGMDSYEKQTDGGLEITYEDYEPGYGTPRGIARTNEMMLWALASTPSREELVKMGDAVSTPPLLVCTPEHLHSTQVFGGAIWGLPDRSTPAKRKLEDLHDSKLSYYLRQIEERRWYGFWDHGDVMHTYDSGRHVWRYDVGGYAWDNSELSTDLWFWYAYLRSGRADIFRMAEAMTRHTGEVDVYHLGRFAGLGTRHGVQHWGDSAKQLRISTAIYRRPYFYLTADERVGDLLKEVVHADARLGDTDPRRKVHPAGAASLARISVGTDWGSAASNWLTEWERTNDPAARSWLVNSMKVIGGNPLGFFCESFGYDPATKALISPDKPAVSVSHLSSVFGLIEICAELIQLLDVPEFENAWLRYCTLYNAVPEEQLAALGETLKGASLTSAHARLTAYAAWRKKDPVLAKRAWAEFLNADRATKENVPPQVRLTPETPVRILPPAVLIPVEEISPFSTNDAAQTGLCLIENLALIGDFLPPLEAE